VLSPVLPKPEILQEKEAREHQEVSQPVLRDPREAVLPLPGIAATRMPSETSLWTDLNNFCMRISHVIQAGRPR